ncbi:ABC transporter substrate-binding protein [Paeniglutamicibacter sp. MACA_103]|uniref:ABC transporter substrate-binding protein n=1 Tax=Paeniglutamicibacter sp. MACA_103 TaxID=3377337 RepID=UPI003893FE83
MAVSACTTVEASVGTESSPVESSAPSIVQVNEEARALLPDRVKQAGILTIASDPTYPPFEYYDTDNTTMIGWDIELGDQLAAVLGLKAEHVPATFDTILPGLTSGKHDMGISSISITEERKKSVDFVPSLAGGTGVAVAPGNPKKLSMDVMTLCGNKIAATKGSIQGLEYLPQFSKECVDAGKKPINIQQFPGSSDANLALMSERVDGVMSGSVSLYYQATLANFKFELAPGDVYEPKYSGPALKKDSDLQPAIEAAMKVLVASPEYAAMNEKWGVPNSAALTTDLVVAK